MSLDTSRHDLLFDKDDFRMPVWIFGLGGTGGETARCLVGDGVGQTWSPLHLVDPDHFEPHNVPSQLVTHTQGEAKEAKVLAVRENLFRTNPEANIHVHPIEAPNDSLVGVSGVVFLCVDSMKARRDIIEQHLEGNPDVDCVIDIRMDVPGVLVYCFDPNNTFQVDCYFDVFYDDAEADEMMGCSDEHFARRSSIIGAVNQGMERFYEFADTCTTEGITNYAKLFFRTGTYESEVWPHSKRELDE